MGAALTAVPFMSLFMGFALIVPLSCILVTVLSSVLALKYRSEFHVRIILPALVGAVPGAVLGTYVLKVVDPVVLEIVMAVFLLVYVAWNFLHKPVVGKEHSSVLLGMCCGFCSGFFGSTISFTGPALAIYILHTGWKQQKALGALGSALIIITGYSCLTHYFAGFYTEEFMTYVAVGIPFGIAGILCSFPFIKYITQELFRKILLLVIGFAGIICLIRVVMHFV